MGFVHGERYIITSAFDGAVFDVKKKRSDDGSKVIAWNFNGQPNQMWTTNVGNGGFSLTPAHTHGGKVLDLVHETSRIVLWTFHGSANQLWNAFLVPGTEDLFFIQNMGSHTVIRNMGLGSPMECVLLNEHDPSVHWRFTQV